MFMDYFEGVYKLLANDQVQKLLNSRNYNDLYKFMHDLVNNGDLNIDDVSTVTQMLLEINENPLLHMNYIPNNYLYWAPVTDVDIPNNIESIGYMAFEHSDLQKLVIPNSVKYLDWYICEGCKALKSVILGNGITNISKGAFKDCNRLKDIDISNSNIEIISENAFLSTDIEQIVLPKSIKDIFSWAFRTCIDLTYVYIPKTIRFIHPESFAWCGSFTIHFDGTIEEFKSKVSYKGTYGLQFVNNCLVKCVNGEIKY